MNPFHLSFHSLPEGSGSGRSLPVGLLTVSTLSALFASVFSFYLIWLQLKNYRKPTLQRYVVRLLLMVPIYSIASVISLYSLELGEVIDLIRDLYEAFVIYCFFNLLIEYLGGERSLIVLLHGRQPQAHMFPANLFLPPMDGSDPYTFLALKRGVLQYVQVKPILAILTVVLKSVGAYGDGKISLKNGYTWVSLVYNLSVFLSLYCLAMFWKCLNDDLRPFRVTSKFLCIKGIIFFSFWQDLGISILVAAGLINSIGPVADPDYISLAVQDFMICLEMPIFALAHAYAFSHTDYIDPFAHYAARLPVYYALRDCIGIYDVISDSLTTLRGTGYGYQTFEPSQGVIHQSLARERRGKAGLRYTQGGKGKYWLPQRGTGDLGDILSKGARHQGPITTIRRFVDQKIHERQAHAPLLAEEAAQVLHTDPDLEEENHLTDSEDEGTSLLHRSKRTANNVLHRAEQGLHFFAPRFPERDDEDGSVTFDSPDSEEDITYQKSRTLHYGDYAYPNVDLAREQVQKSRWKEDDKIVHRRRKKSLTSLSTKRMSTTTTVGKGKQRERTVSNSKEDDNRSNQLGQSKSSEKRRSNSPWLEWDASHRDQDPSAASNVKTDDDHRDIHIDASSHDQEGGSRLNPDHGDDERDSSGGHDSDHRASRDPYGAVDLVVEDYKAEEHERLLERRRGDPALRGGKTTRIFRKKYGQHDANPNPSQNSATTDHQAQVAQRLKTSVERRLEQIESKKTQVDNVETSENLVIDVNLEQSSLHPQRPIVARNMSSQLDSFFQQGQLANLTQSSDSAENKITSSSSSSVAISETSSVWTPSPPSHQDYLDGPNANPWA